MAQFYLTTPIYYVNDMPHIGHAYTTVVADVLSRYQRFFGNEVRFLTGVDEHGQKVQQATEKQNLDPQTYVDQMADNFRNIWKELEIQYDVFYRTTDPKHRAAVQACLQELFDKGEIYPQDYEGLYCVSEEIFYTEKDLVNGKTPFGNDVVPLKERSYFFRMGKYQERLVKHIEENPRFILPSFRRNEVLGFLKQPLLDLCISRPKARLSWGIELPFDKDFVTYVWFDALLNYATAFGLKDPSRKQEFQKWWEGRGAIHLLGKDILTTHAVYWPTMLMALGLRLPETIFAHGWWLTDGGEKMSKSKGTVVRPLDVKDIVGRDPLRYFLCRDIVLGSDAAFSQDLVISRVNTDLANNLGNLLSRVTNLVEKNFDSKVPEMPSVLTPESSALLAEARKCQGEIESLLQDFDLQEALKRIMDVLSLANKYIGDRAPWKAVKSDLPHAAETLRVCLELLRWAGHLLAPVMPEKCALLLHVFGEQPMKMKELEANGLLRTGSAIAKPQPLFPRIETVSSN
jgi:methionyl-tRNA synthetase